MAETAVKEKANGIPVPEEGTEEFARMLSVISTELMPMPESGDWSSSGGSQCGKQPRQA